MENQYLQKSRPILNRKMDGNKYDVELVAVVEEIELVGYLLYKCLFKREENIQKLFLRQQVKDNT